MKKNVFIMALFFMVCFMQVQAFAQGEDADYICIGKFVQGSEDEYWLYDEACEYLPEQLEDTRIYRFQTISCTSDYPDEYEFYISTNKYINIIMEEAYFEAHFNYDNPFSIKLKASGQLTDIEVDEEVLEEGIIQDVRVLTLYDEQEHAYLTSQELAGVDLDNEELFHGEGYLEQFMEDYDGLSELMPDAGIYKFHILHTMDSVTKNYIFVLCDKSFYEENKDKGIQILYVYNYGLQYKGQPLWCLMSLYSQDYRTLRIYDMDEMLSWYEHDVSNETAEDTSGGAAAENSGGSLGTARVLTFFKNLSTTGWVITAMIIIALGEALYLIIKKRKRN